MTIKMKDMKRLYKKYAKELVQCGTKDDRYVSLKGFIRHNIRSIMTKNELRIDNFSQKIQKICGYV